MTAEHTDRELLELAAKAAGIGPILCYEKARDCLRIGYRNSYHLWRPLRDDGDALRLAVKLNLSIRFADTPDGPIVTVIGEWDGAPEAVSLLFDQDAARSTRRAIVRAAASHGKGRGDR